MHTSDPLPGCNVGVDRADTWCVFAGDGDPVVFLHGIPTSSYVWRHMQRLLSPRHRTISFDLLGLGKSRSSKELWGLEAQAAHLARLLDVLGHERVTLVAHDIGAGVAHHFIAAYPKRVRARIFINSVCFADTWPAASVAALSKPLAGEILALIPSRPLLQLKLSRGLTHKERLTPQVLEHYIQTLDSWHKRREFVTFVRKFRPLVVEAAMRTHAIEPIPTLLLWGTQDVFLPLSVGRRMVTLFGQAPLVEVKDAGHFVPEDQPEFVSSIIDAFLAGLPA